MGVCTGVYVHWSAQPYNCFHCEPRSTDLLTNVMGSAWGHRDEEKGKEENPKEMMINETSQS
jgi:hypothetical protein